MGLFGTAHPDCKARIGKPYLQPLDDLVVPHPGCDKGMNRRTDMPHDLNQSWFDDSLSIGDVALVIGAPILALLIAARRSYLLYLSTLYGGWTELYWAIPALAIVSAAVVTVWAWRGGGPHPVAVPLLTACTALTAAGAIAWEVTMQ